MKKKISLTIVSLCSLLSSVFFASCGDNNNIFHSLVDEKKSNNDEGRTALQNGDYDKAISALEKAIIENPNNYQAKSMLATAYLKKIGVDELQIATKITEAFNNKTTNTSEISAVLNVMPAGNSQNIQQLTKAVDALKAIPAENRTKEQNYQLAIASTSLGISVLKQVTDPVKGEGDLSDSSKINSMSETQATTVIEAASLGSTAANNAGMADSGGAKLAKVSGDIANAPGTSNLDKLKYFLDNKK